MDDFLLRFTLEVTVLTPTHIGTGNKLSSKAFVLSGGEVVVIDEDKLIRWVSADRRRVDQFMAFAEDLRAPLGDFFNQQGLTADSFTAYRIKNTAPSPPRDVLEFIKQPNDQPYLPGSSFKGTMKSALLRGYVLSGAALNKPERATQVIDAARPTIERGDRNPGNEAEAPVFVPAKGISRGKRPNYDLIRTMSFADSRPVESSRLQVTEVRVLSAQTNRTLQFKATPSGNRVMQIHAEMLQPGTVLRIPVTVNQALLNGEGAADQLGFKARHALIARFHQYCRRAADNLLGQEITFYETQQRDDLAGRFRSLRKELADLPEGGFLLPIGWGTGFDAKTITDQLGERVFGQVVENYKNTRRLGKPGGTGRWLGSALSPKSRKVAYYADDHLEPIGWLRVELPGG